ncbi:MAG: insulinase family protein, partial [Caldisericaceae bacterium]|nr:insulinase family protein [Caldisericaceae bacterium]
FRLLDDKLSEMALDFQQQLGKLAKRVEMQTITSPVANYLEVKITTTSKKPDFAALRQQTMAFLQKADFSSSEAEMMASANQIKTFFLKNLEKPHMFGIYNAYLIATIGFDEMLDSFEKEHVLHAARQLNAFKVTEQPFMVLQLPKQKSNRQQQLQTEVKLFEGQAGRPTLIVKRNPASQLVAIHFLIKHKAYWQSKFGKKAAQILHDCFGQRLKSEENQAMAQKFGLSVTVNDNPYIPMDDIYLHPDFGYIRIEGLNTDLNGLIDFLSRQMKDFVPNQAEFQKARAKLGAMSGMGMMGDPAKKLFDRLYKEQVYEPSPYPEGAEELTYEALLNFAKNYFQPANMIVSVVSSAKPEAVRQAFAGFAGAPVDQEPEVYSQKIKLHNQPVKIEQAGHGKRAYLFWGFAKAIEPGDAVALKALSLLLGDKIVFLIREKQGMAYHMRAGIKVQPDRALFYISQGTRPENVETLLKQYPTFFTPQVVNEFKEADMGKSVNMYLGRMMFRRLSSINQAYYLGHSYYFYQDIHYDQKFLDALKKVTLEDVRRVAGKYLQVENPVEIVVK